MKEATGELNSTVIVVTAVAIFAVFFFIYLWPIIRGNFEASAKCSDAICGYTCENLTLKKNGNEISPEKPKDGNISCCYNNTTNMTCSYKG